MKSREKSINQDLALYNDILDRTKIQHEIMTILSQFDDQCQSTTVKRASISTVIPVQVKPLLWKIC